VHLLHTGIVRKEKLRSSCTAGASPYLTNKRTLYTNRYVRFGTGRHLCIQQAV